MLILSRRQDESIVIHLNGTILATVMVTELSPGKVRLGCVAIKSLGIDRDTVYAERHPGALEAYRKLTAKN